MARIFSTAPAWTGTIGSGGVPDASTTTIPLSSVTGLTDGAYYVLSIDRVDASGTKTPAKWEVVAGQLSGTNLIDCTRGVEGTAQAHSAGATVEVLFTSYHWEQLKEYLETEHNPDGTHKSGLILTSPVINTSFSGTAKASGSDINTGTDDSKIVTPKAIADSNVVIADKEFSNNLAIKQKDSGGTARNILKLNSSNVLEIGDTNLGNITFNFPTPFSIFKRIAKYTFTSAATSYTFSNLNSSVEKNYILLAFFTPSTTTNVFYLIRFNGDSGNNYCRRYSYFDGTTYSTSNLDTVTWIDIGFNNTTSDYSQSITYIFAPNTSYPKLVDSYINQKVLSTNAKVFSNGAWKNTSSNITSLTVIADKTNGINTGSVLELWASY